MVATKQLDKSNEIGKGGYGRVYIARDLRSKGTTAAIKVLTKVKISDVITCFLNKIYFRKEVMLYYVLQYLNS